MNLLRQIEVEIANGKTTAQACRDAQITAQACYRWRKEYGGLKLDQLKRLVAGLSLEKWISVPLIEPC